MDSIISGLKKYKSSLVRYIKATYIKHFSENTSKFNINYIHKLYTKGLINPTEYLILNQIIQINIIINSLKNIANYGLYCQKTIIEALEAARDLQALFKTAEKIREKHPANYRIFQIINHYAVVHFNKEVYKILHEKIDINKHTQVFLKDILASNTKKDIDIQEDNRHNLTKELIGKLLESKSQTPNNIGSITKKLAEKNTPWLSKSISRLTIDTLSEFVTNCWLPNKLTLAYRADTVIKLKAHITEAIQLESKTGVVINSRLYNKLIETLFIDEDTDKQKKIKHEKSKLKKFIKLQKSLTDQSISSRVQLIKYTKLKLREHIATANIGETPRDITREVKELLEDAIIATKKSKKDHAHTAEIKQDIEKVLDDSKKTINAQSSDEQVSGLVGVSLGTIKLTQDIASAYISDLTGKIIKKAKRTTEKKSQKEKTSQLFFYQSLLDTQSAILAEELEVINYRGLALLTKNQDFARSLDTSCGTDIYIKNFSPIGIQKRLPARIDERKNIITNITTTVKELKKVLKHIPNSLKSGEIHTQYGNIKKTIELLEKDKVKLKKYIATSISSANTINQNFLSNITQPIDKILFYLRANKTRIILNIAIYTLKSLFLLYNTLKFIADVISKALIIICLPLIGLFWCIKKLISNIVFNKQTSNSPATEIIPHSEHSENSAPDISLAISDTQSSKTEQEESKRPTVKDTILQLEQDLLPRLNNIKFYLFYFFIVIHTSC